jgi:hypothetical protein
MPDTLTTDAPNTVIVDQGLLYLRNPAGDIVSADAADGEVMKKVRRGWTPLFEYGQFGSAAYYMDHPYEPLFQAGGARELSVAQIVSMGYHLRPPVVPTCERHVGTDGHLTHAGSAGGRNARERGCWNGARPVHFPQLAGQDVPAEPPECDYCGRDDFPTDAALRQHQSVMHADRRQQVELADGIVAGLLRTGSLPGGTSSAADIATAVVLALRQLEQPKPDPMPDPDADEEEDEDQPEAPQPEPEPEPTPGQKSGWQRQRERQAAAHG